MNKTTTVRGKICAFFRAALVLSAQALPLICFLAVTISIYCIKPVPKATESLFLDPESWSYLTIVLGYFSHPLVIPPLFCVASGVWAKKVPGSFLAPASCVLMIPVVLISSLFLWWGWLSFPPGTELRI